MDQTSGISFVAPLLRRSHSSRRQARRFAGSSAGEIRDGCERQDSQALGLAVPASLLLRADEVIE
jgi:hypothetical protein